MSQKQEQTRHRSHRTQVEPYEQWSFRMLVHRLRLNTKGEKEIKEHFRLLEQTKRGDENNFLRKTTL